MKIASFIDPAGRTSYGIVAGDGVIDLGRRLSGAPSLKALLTTGAVTQAAAHAGATPDYQLAEIRFLPVIPDPEKIICVGLNYRDHVAETGRTVTEKPALFCRYPASQVGHLQPLVKPPESDEYDYEGEVAVIIGKSGRRIAQQDALSHVAGYACYNEGSIRDWQRHTSQFLAGKSFAESGSFGPWMTTSDELPDPSKLTLETRLNGVVVQHTTTDFMITPVPALIEYISTVFPLSPGDVIVTGTPGGVGARRNPPLWMKAGDIAEVEISGVGVLRNPVVAEATPSSVD